MKTSQARLIFFETLQQRGILTQKRRFFVLMLTDRLFIDVANVGEVSNT